ncbi:hypothetical protein ACLOJK_040489 [Asimina triloba]
MQQRAKGFLERMNTMTREKRGLDHAVDPEDRPQDAKKQKVPALARSMQSVITAQLASWPGYQNPPDRWAPKRWLCIWDDRPLQLLLLILLLRRLIFGCSLSERDL